MADISSKRGCLVKCGSARPAWTVCDIFKIPFFPVGEAKASSALLCQMHSPANGTSHKKQNSKNLQSQRATQVIPCCTTVAAQTSVCMTALCRDHWQSYDNAEGQGIAPHLWSASCEETNGRQRAKEVWGHWVHDCFAQGLESQHQKCLQAPLGE